MFRLSWHWVSRYRLDSADFRVPGFYVCSKKTEEFIHKECLLCVWCCPKCWCVPSVLYLCVCVCESLGCVWLCNPVGCSPLGSAVHGTPQARILEWVAIPFSRRSFQPWDWTWVSCIAGRSFTVWATRLALIISFKHFTGGASGKEFTCQCRRCKRRGFNSWVGKTPLEKEMATCASILAWKMPRTEELGGL